MSAEDSIRWLPVGEVGDVRMGKQLSPSSRANGEQFPYLRVANVLDGRIDYSDVKLMGFTQSEREAYALQPGDILLNEGQSLELVGRSAIYRGPAAAFCFQNTIVRFRAGGLVLPEYAQAVFSRWLSTGVFASIAKKTTSIAHLGGDRFAKLLFPVRSLAEQQYIVEMIAASSAEERLMEESITKLRATRAGVVEALLSRSVWGVSLGEVLSGAPRNGYSPTATQEWTGVQVLGLGCLTSDGFAPRQLKNAPPTVMPGHYAMLRDGDLLMSRANTRDLVGLAGVYRGSGTPSIYPDLMMRLTPAEGWSAEALEVVLRSQCARRQIRALAQGTSESMVKISGRSIQAISLPALSIQDQEQLLIAVSSFDQRLEQEDLRLAKLRTVRQGLVDDLLSGRVRVPGAV